jgi:hypothetical protein
MGRAGGVHGEGGNGLSSGGSLGGSGGGGELGGGGVAGGFGLAGVQQAWQSHPSVSLPSRAVETWSNLCASAQVSPSSINV